MRRKPEDIGEPMPEGGNSLQPRRNGKVLRWDPEYVLDQLEAGKSVPQIATELDLHNTTVYEKLLSPEYQDKYLSIQSARALATLEKAEQDVEVAPDAHALNRAREAGRMAMWRLERTLRRIYGQDRPMDAPAVAIYLNLSGNSVRTIEQDGPDAEADPSNNK